MTSLQNLFPEGRAGRGSTASSAVRLYSSITGLTSTISSEHAAVVGDDFHGQVRLAIGGAAGDGRADAGGVFRVDQSISREM